MRMRPLPIVAAIAAIALGIGVLGAGGLIAQIEGGGGVAAIDSSGDYEVSGVSVDVAGNSADVARFGGWRVAQRKAWQQLSQRLGRGTGLVSDGTLDSLVSGIVVENEQIGPKRYVARLGVLFNRARASSILGIADYVTRSPPMLVIPVTWSGGTGQVFEQRTAWQEAWARYRTGNSTLDYIRPSGAGADPLLLNVGQTGRPGRGWWRAVLDQYGATNILIPTVRLYRQWPGGPVIGVFEARYGPDNLMVEQFTLKVGTASGIPALLDAGVKRMDEAYQEALRSGYLRADPGLSYTPPVATPTPGAVPTDAPPPADTGASPGSGSGSGASTVTIQFDTPTATAVANVEGAMRGIAGVSSATTSSLALGGVSLMRIGFDGPPEALKAALEARGWQVISSGTTIRIRRAPQLLPPDLTPDNATAGG